MFSPSYFRTREHPSTSPFDHCALNIALYGCGRGNWAFTEYPRNEVHRQSDALAIGRNQIHWNGERLKCTVDDTTAPLPKRIRGTVTVYPEALPDFTLALDGHGIHQWRPIAPRARILVNMENPPLRWSGTGYLDSNRGSAPLDEGMRRWSWQRAHSQDETTIIYDINPTGELRRTHAVAISRSGEVRTFCAPEPVALPSTGWRIRRETHADPGSRPRVITTLEDAPFYARSLIDTQIRGLRQTAVHESLSLDRFRSPWVRALLPFRMRRSRR